MMFPFMCFFYFYGFWVGEYDPGTYPSLPRKYATETSSVYTFLYYCSPQWSILQVYISIHCTHSHTAYIYISDEHVKNNRLGSRFSSCRPNGSCWKSSANIPRRDPRKRSKRDRFICIHVYIVFDERGNNGVTIRFSRKTPETAVSRVSIVYPTYRFPRKSVLRFEKQFIRINLKW